MHRYEMTDDGHLLGTVTYRVLDDGPPEVRELEHTDVEPDHRGEGVGGELAAGVIALVREAGIGAVVTCEYLQSWMTKHPEARDVMVDR